MSLQFNALMDALHTPAVRDLAWAIGSPCLLDVQDATYAGRVVDDAWCDAQLQACAPWLAELDRDPASLHTFIAAHPTRRLGHYFESLIAFWLVHMPDMQLIATNLQVKHAGRTLGEFDFLFRDGNAAVCHWEAAVKFYLQAEPVTEPRVFIGPGARDRLDLKLDRVFTHQLELGKSAEGRAALPAGITLDKEQAFIKGMLFFPATPDENFSAPHIAMPGISSRRLCGWWTRHPLEKLPHATENSRWIIAPRLGWLSPARLAAQAEVMTHQEIGAVLDQHFSASTEAVLVTQLKKDTQGIWQEASRGFVVNSKWPTLSPYPSDGTPSHSTRPRNDNGQVAGYPT